MWDGLWFVGRHQLLTIPPPQADWAWPGTEEQDLGQEVRAKDAEGEQGGRLPGREVRAGRARGAGGGHSDAPWQSTAQSNESPVEVHLRPSIWVGEGVAPHSVPH